MDEVVAAVDEARREKGRGRAEMPPKLSLHGEEGAFSQVMAAAFPASAARGEVGDHRARQRRRRPARS